MNQEEKETVLTQEATFLENLVEAANWQKEYEKIDIVRKGKLLFSFRICGLTQEEIETIVKKSTVYTKTRAGLRGKEDFKDAEYNARLIYSATHPDDRAVLWDNKEARKAVGAMSPLIMIGKILRPGDLMAIAMRINKLSGVDEDGDVIEEREEFVKNS